ncbi:MAG: RHS repeat-associated core domain-containing protein, partial [Acidobacteriota bacterium]
ERDNESGLDYFLARYYSSAQARFTSTDAPFADQSEGDPQSWNLYVYVGNNPLNHTDPSGLWVQVTWTSGDGATGSCWQAETGDTLQTLSAQTGVSLNALRWAFNGIDIIPDTTIFDVSGAEQGFQEWLKEASHQWSEEMSRSMPIGGVGRVGAGAARSGGPLSKAWSAVKSWFGRGGSRGVLTGSLRGLTQAEKGMVEELLA